MRKTDTKARIRALNDAWRRCRRGHGRTFIAAGLHAQGPAFVAKVMALVRSFEDFTPDNDPWGEHDFGALTVEGRKVFWKIDYYDPTLTMGSEDPSDESKTCRVLTVMLAEDY